MSKRLRRESYGGRTFPGHKPWAPGPLGPSYSGNVASVVELSKEKKGGLHQGASRCCPRTADFPTGRAWAGLESQAFPWPAGKETCDTADWEVCGTGGSEICPNHHRGTEA